MFRSRSHKHICLWAPYEKGASNFMVSPFPLRFPLFRPVLGVAFLMLGGHKYSCYFIACARSGLSLDPGGRLLPTEHPIKTPLTLLEH